MAAWTALRTAIVGAAFLSAACTSVSWTDSNGARHHVGLVLARETTREDYGVVDRWSLGADWRIDGSDSGWTAGLARRTSIAIAIRDATAQELSEEYLRFMEAEHDPPHTERTRWGFLYFKEAAADPAQFERCWSLGVDVAYGNDPSGLVVPFGSWSRVNESALRDDVVIAIRASKHEPDRLEMRCWRLATSSGGRSESRGR